jgi:hypothetical protein
MGGKHDGDRFGRLARGLDLGRRRGEDDINIHAHQLSREFRKLFDRVRPTELDDDVLALDIAKVAQARPQSLDPVRLSSGWSEPQESNARDFCWLLRARCERPCNG